MSTLFGINVDRDCSTPVELLTDLGVTVARIVALLGHDQPAYLRALKSAGIKPLVVIARESLSPGGDFRTTAGHVAQRFGDLAWAWQIGNEPDHVSPSSWTMTEGALGELVYAFRVQFPQATLVLGGLADGRPGYLDGLGGTIPLVDAIAVHPYGRRPTPRAEDWSGLPGNYGFIGHLLAEYRERAKGKPIWITEYGCNSAEAGQELQARYTKEMTAALAREQVAVATIFCASDEMVSGFGLVSVAGNQKPAYQAFREVVRQPEGEPTMTEYEQFCRAEAARRGIDPDVAVRVANTEGGLTEPARRGTFDTGSSWWSFQLHYGGPGYEEYGTVAGMGNGFTAITGWRPGDPNAWRDAMRYSLDAARRGGWSPWYGAATVGISGFHGIDRSVPWTGTPDHEWDYRQHQQPPAYNPDAPIRRQINQWTCSIVATGWLLRSVGRVPADNPIEGQSAYEAAVLHDEMSPSLVNSAVGLRDASGGPLAAFLRDRYRLDAHNAGNVNWDDVKALAGTRPVLIGGRAWNHWVGVRRFRGDVLDLANPAPGFGGIGTTLRLDQFAALGPFSAVWAEVKPADVPVDLAARVRALELEMSGLKTALAHVVDKLILDPAKEAERIREQYLGKRPA